MASTKYQYFAALIVNWLAMSYGIACGWVSPYLSYLSSDETPLDAKLTSDEASLIAAILCAGGFVGNPLFAWFSNRVGRRYPLLFLALPQMLGWILTIYAQNAYYLYVARFAQGLCGGGTFAVVPAYVSEIADDRIRGTLGSYLVLHATFGTLLMFIFGEYCHYDFTSYFTIGVALVFLCIFYFFPETPTMLVKMNRPKDAEKSICFYRGFDKKSKADMESLKIEMNKLQSTRKAEGTSDDDSKLAWSDFSTPVARKAMLIGIGMATLNQFCGTFAMINYTSSIFRESGSNLSPNESAIVVGVIQLLGAYVSTLLVDRAGRKMLMSFSATGLCLGLACLGTYLYLKNLGFDMVAFGWVPMVSFSFTIFVGCCGVLTLPFLIMAEMLPEKIKDIGASFCMSIIWSSAFILVKYFTLMADFMGMHGCMFFFSVCSMIGAIFIMTVMPETKGKSFEEIAELLKR